MSAEMVHTIANDVTVTCAFADTVEMAQYLASEAHKVPYAPYASQAGMMMDHLAGHAVWVGYLSVLFE